MSVRNGEIVRGPDRRMTKEVQDRIIDLMLCGHTLHKACREAGVSRSTVYYFMHLEDPEAVEFRNRYDRAFALRFRFMANEILDIIDDAEDDFVERENEDGETYIALNRDHITRAVARVKSRQWMMERLAPERFGRSINPESQSNGNVVYNITQVNFENLPPGTIKPKVLPGGYRLAGEDDVEDI